MATKAKAAKREAGKVSAKLTTEIAVAEVHNKTMSILREVELCMKEILKAIERNNSLGK